MSRTKATTFIYRSTKSARNLGAAARSVFEKRGYTLRRCRPFLDLFVEEVGEDRIFSGISFFNHRHEVHRAWEEKYEQWEEGGRGAGGRSRGFDETVLVWIG